jgi:hypothetical protein
VVSQGSKAREPRWLEIAGAVAIAIAIVVSSLPALCHFSGCTFSCSVLRRFRNDCAGGSDREGVEVFTGENPQRRERQSS